MAALEILQEGSDIDLIISDMRMPEMDGATFLAEAAKNWPDIQRILLTGYADIGSAVEAINNGKIYQYLHKPWEENDLIQAVKNALASKILAEENQRLQLTIQQHNDQLKEWNQTLEEKVNKKTAELQQAHNSCVEVLSTIVQMDEKIGGIDCRDIANIAQAIAEYLELNIETIQNIYFAGLLHNLGKIGMDRALCCLPIQKMSIEQRKEYKQYPMIGEATLMAFASLSPIATIISHQKEYVDGCGYPRKLKGDDLPKSSRILPLIIDYFELQKGLLLEEILLPAQAVSYIESHRGTYYDEDVTRIFIQHIQEWLEKEDFEEMVVSVTEVVAGQVLTKDLLSTNGLVLLPRGKELTESYIKKLRDIGNLKIHVKKIED